MVFAEVVRETFTVLLPSFGIVITTGLQVAGLVETRTFTFESERAVASLFTNGKDLDADTAPDGVGTEGSVPPAVPAVPVPAWAFPA